ncbi:hypothetical protein OEA41_002159 [Lepraria neglecta]|uniref:Uncharacterized protein n=1 Tax=Lepraria neglecta TaxID=209136 RepID=A0AAD9ZED3_9LECA|nr:hypothetical protein OEA41_002159 [Lepraria neglecta]
MSWALIYTKNFKASDYRDKLYAVLNFADRTAHPDLQPDYECPLEEVYLSYATKLIEQSDYPILLHIAGIGLQKSLLTLPSWVPDFSPGPFSVHVTGCIRKKVFEASGTLPVNTVSIDPSLKTLSFKGVQIDTIGLIFRQPSPDDLWGRGSSKENGNRWNPFLKAARKVLFPGREYYESFVKFINDIKVFLNTSHASSHSRSFESKETLCYTLIGDYPTGEATVGSDLQEAYNAWYSSYRELAGHHTIKSFFASALRNREIYGQIQKFEDLRAASVNDSPIFGTTTKRLLGFGPEGMLPGDILCIILGAHTPFLLRPDTDCKEDQSGKRWKLVGPCFVHGLMYGEGLSMGEPKEFVVT